MASKPEVDQRRNEISRLVTETGFVRATDLAEQFHVTTMTIHRDLDALSARGVLAKVRSGARATLFEERERNVAFREHHMVQQKRAIAAAAIAWLDEHADLRVVALDDSTTALAMLPALIERSELTIVTNFHRAIDHVSPIPGARLIAVGGSYSHEFQSFNGTMTIDALRSLQIDVVFMSTTAVGSEAIFHPVEAPLLTKRAMMRQAERSVLLVDHTKFERRALHRQAALSEFAAVVVDDGIAPQHLERLSAQGSRVIVAPVSVARGAEK